MRELHIEVESLKTNPETGLMELCLDTYAVFYTVDHPNNGYPNNDPPDVEPERIVNLETGEEAQWEQVFTHDPNEKSPRRYLWGTFWNRAVDLYMNHGIGRKAVPWSDDDDPEF